MASTSGPSLAHRSVSSIRSTGAQSPGGSGSGPGPTSPHTPLRPITSAFSSPSSLRAEEDTIVIELGTRRLRVGFAGDPVPKGLVAFGPEQQRRVGDFRAWQQQGNAGDGWRKRGTSAEDWGRDYELWRADVRGLDLGLVEDKLERGLREAFSKYLLMDSRPRKMALVLPPAMPLPLLSTTLDTLFNRFQCPSVSLTSNAVMCAAAAGLRSALVIDLGWAETVVTSVYEYREVQSSRSVRGGRMLVNRLHRLLASALAKEGDAAQEDTEDKSQEYVVSFEECEEVALRMLYCKPAPERSSSTGDDVLPTVAEQDEDLAGREPDALETAQIPLRSTTPATTINISYDQLTEPCENTFFETQYSHASWDDHELPIHLLVYRHLLQLPLDVRAICMSRIIFTGGCANVLGLRARIFSEVSRIVESRGWDPVQGKGVEQLRANVKLQKGSRLAKEGPTPVQPQSAVGVSAGQTEDTSQNPNPANAVPEFDDVEEQVQRGKDKTAQFQGQLRAVESLGPWSGASLLTQLKVSAIATIDRELWLQQGAAGAARPIDVDFKAQQRQSLGAGGLIRSATAGTSWTLGAWGST